MRILLVLIATVAFQATAVSLADGVESLRLNQVQVIGTHNSYHIAPTSEVMEVLDQIKPGLGRALDYTRGPLSDQFSIYGIRQIELDIYADPEGGLFADPIALRDAFPTLPKIDDHGGALLRPGMKVLHVQDIDQATTTPTLVSALTEVRDWLRANPNQGPLLILIEMKSDQSAPLLTKPHPFGDEELAQVDTEIFSVFDRGEVIMPDDIRGDWPTLRQAVLNGAWPLVSEARGKVLFKIDNKDLSKRYAPSDAQLRGRPMFPDVASDHPAAAMMNQNDPINMFDDIQALVRQGFLVRTRADSGTEQARSGDTTRRERAFASGAQFISTDYPAPDERFTDYCVRLPNGAVMCPNPITATTKND